MRHMAIGSGAITQLADMRGPMSHVLDELATHLAELAEYRRRFGPLSSHPDGADETDEGSDTEQE